MEMYKFFLVMYSADRLKMNTQHYWAFHKYICSFTSGYWYLVQWYIGTIIWKRGTNFQGTTHTTTLQSFLHIKILKERNKEAHYNRKLHIGTYINL